MSGAVRLRPWAQLAAAMIAVAGLSIFGIELARPTGRIAAIWLANAAVVVALLNLPTRRWAVWVFGCWLSNVWADRYCGDSWATACALATFNSLEILLAAAPVRRFCGARPDLIEGRALAVFLFWGGLFAPLVSATLAAAWLAWARGLNFLDSGRIWFLADLLGLLNLVPPLLWIWQRRHEPLFGRQPESAVLSLLLVAVSSVFVFAQSRLPLLFLVLPTMIFATFRFGYSGAVIAQLLVACIALILTIGGSGPLQLVVGMSLPQRILLLQIFLVVSLFTILPIGVVLERHRRLETRLRDSETRYRLLAETTLDLVMLTDAGLRIEYASPAAYGVAGCAPAALLGRELYAEVYREDIDALRAALQTLPYPGDAVTVTFRFGQHGIGTTWVEANCQRMQRNDGESGGYLFVLRDVSIRKHTELQLEEANRRLETLAKIDSLTGICNRRVFDDSLIGEWRRSARTGEVLALFLIDIDLFKDYNDRYGHQAGDECLRRVGLAIRDAIRRGADLAARYGGEEFVVILPHTEVAGARYVAEGVAEAIRALGITHDSSPFGIVTVSIGIACLVPSITRQPAELVQAADLALYRAKLAGRNAIKTAQSEDSGSVFPVTLRS